MVGSGVAGLAAAIRLSGLGFRVTVLEKNAYFGGKLSAFERGGFRFDAGPSLFTMPHLVTELLEHTPFHYTKWETACHYFFEDGTQVNFPSDPEKLVREVSAQLQTDPKKLKEHLDRSAYIYKKTAPVFMERSLHRWRSYFSTHTLKAILAIPKLGIFTTMHRKNSRKLLHPKLVQIFDRYATYNGSNPYRAPGILNVIPHLEHGIGTFFPEDGMHAITQALLKEARARGVQLIADATVTCICEDGRQVSGVDSTQGHFPTEVVVCNSDIKPAYRYLLKNTQARKRTLTQEPSSSALIFYWGIRGQFPKLDLHNILFSDQYAEEFRAIFETGEIHTDPTVYIHISSRAQPSDAPEGCENWFVMINVPANTNGADWEELRIKARRFIIDKINRILETDIEALIMEEDYLDPVRIESRTSSFAGALYGASSNERMAAFFRHANFSRVRGLYFVGGSVHPGGGIPLCLLSARITCELVKKDYRL